MKEKATPLPKNLIKLLRPIESLKKTWLRLDIILNRQKESLLKEDLISLEELLNQENFLIKEVFDLSELILTLEKDLKKEGYKTKPFFLFWLEREKNNKKEYLLKKEKIIYAINKKKEKVLEQSHCLREESFPKIRHSHQNFPLPKILNIHV